MDDPLMITILEKSNRQVQIFNDYKTLCKKGEMEVIFLYGFLCIRKSNHLSNDEKIEKLARLVQFLTVNRKKLGINGFFITLSVLNSLKKRLGCYIKLFNDIKEGSLIGHTIFSAIYLSPLQENVKENANLFEGTVVTVMAADMYKSINANTIFTEK